MKFTKLKINLLEGNKGQIEGLPKNPRRWTNAEIERLQRSIEETPELAEARPIIVYPLDTKYIVIGGNLRYEALKRMKVDEAYCCVLDKMSPSKLKEMAIKDNGQFGSWDEELLKTEWSEIEFAEWGIDVFTVVDEELLNEKSAKPDIDTTKTFEVKFSSDEFDFVNKTLRALNPNSEEALLTILGYYDREA